MVLCRVHLLDGKDYQCDVDKRALGQELLDRVFEHLNILEREYFGLSYRGLKNVKCWLITSKKIEKQIKFTEDPLDFTFEVKFYVPEPATLREELTRYLLFLQVRTDIQTGKLPCSFLSTALLSSYAVQSQVGDYEAEKHGSGIEYIKDIPFSPNQSEELLEKVAEMHPLHKGDINAEAELKYLENAKNLSLYGVHLHPARDELGEDVTVGVSCIGLLIFKDKIRINRYPWAKIIKISYKRNHFDIKIRPPENDPKKKETARFKLEDVKYAGRLWRIAMEHHIFFRMKEAEEMKRSMFWRSGNKYRYTGRTEYQTQKAIDSIPRSGNDFSRVAGTGKAGLGNGAGGLGYSTERTEQCIADESRVATLNIRRQGNVSRGSIPNFEAPDVIEHASRASGATSPNRLQEGYVDILLGAGAAHYNKGGYAGSRSGAGSRLDDRPGSAGYYPNRSADRLIDLSVTVGGRQRGPTSRDGDVDHGYEGIGFDPTRGAGGYNGNMGGYDNGYDPNRNAENGYDNGWNGNERNNNYPNGIALAPGLGHRSRGDSSSSSGSSSDSESRGGRGLDDHLREQDDLPRDQYGNLVITKNIYINRTTEEDRLRRNRLGSGSIDSRSQDDYYAEQGAYGRGRGDDELWGDGGVSPNGTSKTTSRTYTAPDGTVITEYRTERNGVITTRIEKRTRVTDQYPDDFDYDKALRDAIHQVTDMNPDLDVEKIEIHTKSEERYDETPDYSLV